MTGTAPPGPGPPRRLAGRRRMLAVGAGVLLLGAAAVVAGAAPWERLGADPRSARDGQAAAGPLPGVPPRGASGLRLLVSGDPTLFVLDVDTGAVELVTGLPAGDDRSTHAEPVGEHAVVVSRRDCRGRDCDGDAEVYLVRRGSTVATRLGQASDIEAARGGRGVWLLRRQDAARCTLGQVGLDGRPHRPAQPVPCGAALIEELPAGLLVYVSGPPGADPYSALVTRDGAVRRLPRLVDGVAGGDQVLGTVEPGNLVALTDLGRGASHLLPWPSRLDDHVMGLVEGHPDGRLACVGFYPARNRATQTLDVWLLDLATRGWRQLPDMPLRLGPAKPQLTWTADGRLLLLAGLAGEPAGLVAVWRPGDPRITARRVPLPGFGDRDGFRFVIR